MSGPIVRKYGFPNFDQIFGKKEMEHGVDEPETDAGPAAETPAPDPVAAPAAVKPAEGKKAKTREK